MTKFSAEYLVQLIMFWLTIIFLSLASIFVEYGPTEAFFLPYAPQMATILLILWPTFFIEQIVSWGFCHKTWKSCLALTLFPPLRLAMRRCHQETQIWWNFRWQLVDPALYYRLERRFMFPLLILSLIMIPFWIIEIFFPRKMLVYPLLYHFIHLGNALIWGLFVTEFIIIFSIAPKRLEYLKLHWLEIFIIILPMLALARILIIRTPVWNSLPFFESIKFIKLTELQRTLNIYRSRVLLNRIIKIFIMIDIVEYFYLRRNPQKYRQILQNKLQEKEQELLKLRKKIVAVEKLIQDYPKES